MSGPSPVSDRVPVAPLREAFLESNMTLSQVCYRLGWTRTQLQRGRSKPYVLADVARLKRVLGMQPCYTRGNRPYYASRIGYEHAVAVARAIGADPVDLGL